MEECRICLSEDSIENMISPCLCRGTSKYVHISCLNRWRTLSLIENSLTHCPTCKFKYILEKKNCESKRIMNNLLKEIGRNYFTLFWSNTIISLIFSLILNVITGKIILYSGPYNFFDFGKINISIFQVSILILQFLYFIIFSINFFTSKNKILLINYYKKKDIFAHFVFNIISIFFLIFIDILGLLISLFASTMFINIYINELKSIHAVQDEDIISLVDTDERLII